MRHRLREEVRNRDSAANSRRAPEVRARGRAGDGTVLIQSLPRGVLPGGVDRSRGAQKARRVSLTSPAAPPTVKREVSVSGARSERARQRRCVLPWIFRARGARAPSWRLARAPRPAAARRHALQLRAFTRAARDIVSTSQNADAPQGLISTCPRPPAAQFSPRPTTGIPCKSFEVGRARSTRETGSRGRRGGLPRNSALGARLKNPPGAVDARPRRLPLAHNPHSAWKIRFARA